MAKQQQRASGNNASVKQPGFLKKHATLLCLLVLSIVFWVNYTRIYDTKIDMNGDNIHYYALGKAIVDGKGYTNTMDFKESPHTHFPPGYSFFIASLMKIGLGDIQSVKKCNGLLLYGSILLLFLLIYRCTKSRLIAFTCAFMASFHVINLRFATIMMSETLCLFLSLLILTIVLSRNFDQLFDKQRKWQDLVLFIILVLSIGYIYLVRTLSTSLVLAVILYYAVNTFLAFRKKDKVWIKRLAVCLSIVVVFVATQTAWSLRDKSVGKTGSNYVTQFQRKLNGETMSTIEDWTTRIQNNIRLNTTQWIPKIIFAPESSNAVTQETASTTADWILGLLIFGMLIYGIASLTHGRLLFFAYIGLNAGVLLLWPEQFGGPRYLSGITPLLVFLFINGCCNAVRWLYHKAVKHTNKIIGQLLPWAVCFLFVIIALPQYAKDVNGYAEYAKFKTYTPQIVPPMVTEYIEAIQWAGQHLPPTAHVSTRKPELFYIYSGGHKSCNFPYYGSPESIYQYFMNNQTEYVIIDRMFRHAYVTVIPVINKYPKSFSLVYTATGMEKDAPRTYIFAFHPNQEDINNVNAVPTTN